MTGITQPDFTGGMLKSNPGTLACRRSWISGSGTPSPTHSRISLRHSPALGLGQESRVFPGQKGLAVFRTIDCTWRLSAGVSSAEAEALPNATRSVRIAAIRSITGSHKHGGPDR